MTAIDRQAFLGSADLCSATLAGTRRASAARAADPRPNIVLFISDDQDKHSIGAYGGQSFTPHRPARSTSKSRGQRHWTLREKQ